LTDTTLSQTTDETEAVSSLLSGEPEKAKPEAPEKDHAEGEEAAEPEKEPAAADEPEKDEVDYGMKVPITGGEPVTLGELKDLYQGRHAAQLELIERENGVLREMEKSAMLLQYVHDLPEHVREAASQQAVADYQREMQTLVSIVPELKTEEGSRAVKDAIYSLAAEYGVQRRDIDQIKHAVTVKMLYDFARLRGDIRAAKANVKPLRSTEPAGKRPSSSHQPEAQQLAARAKQTRNSGDELAAIESLLRSKSA
jgi:hypothetical protein